MTAPQLVMVAALAINAMIGWDQALSSMLLVGILAWGDFWHVPSPNERETVAFLRERMRRGESGSFTIETRRADSDEP